VFKAQIAGKYAGVEVDTTPNFVMGETNKTPEFLALNPNGKVPTLESPDGPVWESNAIARHVARSGNTGNLFGSNNYEHTLVDQWIEWSRGIEVPGAAWIYPILGFVPNNKQATSKAKGEIRAALKLLNDHLLTRTFLVNERVSLADIVVAMTFLPLYKMVLDNGFRKQFVNTNRWFLTCVNQPEFKAVVGDVELCQKMMVAPEAPAAEAEEKKGGKKKGGDKKESKKEEAPKEQPKKKAKNPLDLLPPTPFDLEEWKRTYSNAASTKGDAMPWFWEKFDAAGWSLWFGDFKHNEDNTVLFQTCNLVGGYAQRLESLRKYGFGNILILGEEGPFEITCAFLVRGLEIPPELSDCPDSELYNWRRCDPSNADDKELLEDVWAWEGAFKGHKSTYAADGKVFK